MLARNTRLQGCSSDRFRNSPHRIHALVHIRCGCYHEVVVHSDDDIVAVCTCDPRVCNTVPIAKSDIVVYELDRPALHSAIAGALSLEPKEADVPHLRGTTHIGIYSQHTGCRLPVAEPSGRFVAKMEDILDVYERPYDPKRPVVCIDEKSKQLLSTPKGSIPAAPGRPERVDSEYQRGGTANIFSWIEPLIGRRDAKVTERRTAIDFAEQLKELTDVQYPDAEKVVLVCDNLNTHSSASLYELYDPAEAHRIAQKIEWHYTPEHGSWLSIAEIELSILSRQCLNRRIADIDTLRQEVAAYNLARNQVPTTIDWQFKTVDARVKLKRLYPVMIHN